MRKKIFLMHDASIADQNYCHQIFFFLFTTPDSELFHEDELCLFLFHDLHPSKIHD